jgi:hypothetical protein
VFQAVAKAKDAENAEGRRGERRGRDFYSSILRALRVFSLRSPRPSF